MLLLSPRELELIQRNFIFRFSIGSKGARDDGRYFVRNMAEMKWFKAFEVSAAWEKIRIVF